MKREKSCAKHISVSLKWLSKLKSLTIKHSPLEIGKRDACMAAKFLILAKIGHLHLSIRMNTGIFSLTGNKQGVWFGFVLFYDTWSQ